MRKGMWKSRKAEVAVKTVLTKSKFEDEVSYTPCQLWYQVHFTKLIVKGLVHNCPVSYILKDCMWVPTIASPNQSLLTGC